MLSMSRTHRFRDDTKWLPRGVRYTKAMYTGGGLALYASASLAILAANPYLLVAWKGIGLAGFGGALLADKIGKKRFERKIKSLAKGGIPFAGMKEQENGVMVILRGHIESEETITGLLHGAEGVYRRMRFENWVHEAATDFILVSDDGERIPIDAKGARWLSDFREPDRSQDSWRLRKANFLVAPRFLCRD